MECQKDLKISGIIKEYEYIAVLQSLKVLYLSVISSRFYESPNLKCWICELCKSGHSC